MTYVLLALFPPNQRGERERERERDLMKQQEFQGVILLKKKPKPLRKALEVLLPVSIISFLLSYYSSCLPCFLHSITSLLHSLNHFTTRKVMFLFANAIILFLARDSGLSATSSAFVNNLYDEHITRIGDNHSSHSDSIDLEPRTVDKKVIEESVVLIMKISPSSIEAKELVVDAKAVGERMRTLEVVLVEEGVGGEGMEVKAVEDELELLGIDELNRRFDEFIEREKRKMRLEASQLVMV